MTTRGYPGQYAKLMYTSSGYINLDDNKGELLFQIDITGGQSGSPLYKSNHSVIGIVTSEVSKNGTYIYNIGTKITEPLFIKIGGKLPTGGEFTDGGGFLMEVPLHLLKKIILVMEVEIFLMVINKNRLF